MMTSFSHSSSIAAKTLAVLLATSLTTSGVPVATLSVSTAFADDVATQETDAKTKPADLLTEAQQEFLEQQTIFGQTPIDVSADWSAGSLSITTGGYYRLDADVQADTALQVSLEKGQIAVLDLNGHDVLTSSAASQVIDVESKGGVLMLVDSSAWTQASAQKDDTIDADTWADPASSLTLELSADQSQTDVVKVKAETSDNQELNDTDVSFICENVMLSSKVSDPSGETPTSVTGVSAENAVVYLAGDFASRLEGAAKAIDFAANKQKLYWLDNSFRADQFFQVSQTNLAENDVFAVVGEGFSSDDIQYAFVPTAGEGRFVYRDEVSAFRYEPKTTRTAAELHSRIGSTAAVEGLSDDLEDADGAGDAAVMSEGVDLNALWTENGLDTALTLKEGGTYYLSADLTASSMIFINAAGADVTLDLQGHTFTCTSLSTSGYAIYGRNASNLTVKNGSIEFDGSPVLYAIRSTAAKLTVSDLSIHVQPDQHTPRLSDLLCCGIYASSGEVTASNTTIDLDLTNQSNSDFSGNSTAKNGPRGFSLDKDVTSATLTGCKVTVHNSNVALVQDFTDLTKKGYAFGLYSLTKNAVTVSGCSFDVGSAQGVATGLYGANIELTGARTTVEANGGQRSFGLFAAQEGAILLDAPLSVSLGDRSDIAAALYSRVENGFVLGGGLSDDALSAMVSPTDDHQNEQNARIATFAANVSANRQSALAGVVTNALADGACFVTNDAKGLFFRLSEDKAPAEVIHDGQTVRYASFSSAIDAAVSGDTVKALGDLGDVVFGKSGTIADSYVIDLGGYSANSFLCTSGASVTLQNGAIDGYNSNNFAAIGYTGAGQLTVRDVEVRNCAANIQYAYGVLLAGSGACVLDGVDIHVSALRDAAYGVNQTVVKAGQLTISGGSIRAEALSSTTICGGVVSSATANDIAVDRCPVVVSGRCDKLYGFDVQSHLSVTGSVGTASVTAINTGAAAEAYGIVARNDSTRVELTDFSVEMSTQQKVDGAAYWCLSSGSTNDLNAASWNLSGQTKLNSSTQTDVRLKGATITLSADFSNIGNRAITVDSTGLTDQVFATALGSDLANSFEPAVGSKYAGWSAVQADGQLTWTHAAMIRNESTQATYVSLRDAIDQASAGDALTLMEDLAEWDALSIDKSLTLDLAGHQLTLHAGQSASAGDDGHGAAVAVSDGTLTLKDSATEKGSLSIDLGATTEIANTAKYGYQGLCVYGSAGLAIDGAQVSVTYTGSTVSEPQFSLKGVSCAGSAVTLTHAACLTVNSSADSESFGATQVYGIYAEKDSTSSITVDADSQVNVCNRSVLSEIGKVAWPNQTNTTGTGADSTIANLMRLDVTEGSDLYNQIQEAFLLDAQYDSSLESDSSVYDLNVYYVTSYVLDDGPTIWAYSDPVDSENSGYADTVVAKYIYVRHTYDVAMDAYGIASDEAFAGKVNIAGAVDAQTSKGHAFGVYENEAATWTVDDTRCTATASEDTYFALSADKLDLAKVINFPTEQSGIVYPDDGLYGQVVEMASTQIGVGHQGTDYDEVVATSTTHYAGDAADAAAVSVDVTFTNLRDDQGSLKDDVTLHTAYGQTLEQAGCEKVTQNTYRDESDGLTYEFVGWKVSGTDMGYYVYDPDDLYDSLAMDCDIAANKGPVTCTAWYVPVGEGQHLATFKAEYAVCAYAVDDGKAASFLDGYGSGAMMAPARLVTETGYTFSFKGWLEGRSDDSVYTEGEDVYTGLLPCASANVTYTAQYTKFSTLPSYNFCTKIKDSRSGSYVWYVNKLDRVDWTGDYTDQVNAVAKKGDTYIDNGVTYTMIGWSSRVSDHEALVSEGVPVLDPSTDEFNNRDYYWAVYQAQEQKMTVNFYVEGQLYATASDMSTTSTVQDAFYASSNPTKPTNSSADYAFRGWNVSEDASSILSASVTRLSSLMPETGELTINLYALWSETYPTVTFYDEDKTTVIDEVSLKSGTTVEDELGETVTPTGTKKDLFKGWVDSTGAAWTTKTKVYSSMSVYATYTQTNSGTGSLTPSSSSDSSATKNSSQLSGSTSLSGASLSTSSVGGSLASAGSSSAVAASSGTSSLAGAVAAASTDDGDSVLDVIVSDSDESMQIQENEDNGPDDTAGTALFYSVFALAILGVIGAIRWFFKRRKNDDADEDDLFSKLDESESLHF